MILCSGSVLSSIVFLQALPKFSSIVKNTHTVLFYTECYRILINITEILCMQINTLCVQMYTRMITYMKLWLYAKFKDFNVFLHLFFFSLWQKWKSKDYLWNSTSCNNVFFSPCSLLTSLVYDANSFFPQFMKTEGSFPAVWLKDQMFIEFLRRILSSSSKHNLFSIDKMFHVEYFQ